MKNTLLIIHYTLNSRINREFKYNLIEDEIKPEILKNLGWLLNEDMSPLFQYLRKWGHTQKTSLNYNYDMVESKERGLRRDGVENKDLLERWGERGGGGERGGREGWERERLD